MLDLSGKVETKELLLSVNLIVFLQNNGAAKAFVGDWLLEKRVTTEITLGLSLLQILFNTLFLSLYK